MPKAIVPMFKVCSGCRVCEQACSLGHFGTINPKKSRITIVKRGIENDLAVVCNHGLKCGQECIYSCPVDCIKNQDGVVNIIAEDCIGCEACVEACPYHCIKMVDKLAIKCDLCSGDPKCVKYCPLGAIIFDSEPRDNFDEVRALSSGPGKGG